MPESQLPDKNTPRSNPQPAHHDRPTDNARPRSGTPTHNHPGGEENWQKTGGTLDQQQRYKAGNFNPNVKLDPSIVGPPAGGNDFVYLWDQIKEGLGITPGGSLNNAQTPGHYEMGHAMGQVLARELLARRDYMIYEHLKSMGIVE